MPSVDQAALFQHTFAERGAILLESFEQWLKGQTRVIKKIPRSTQANVRVGIGVYLVQERTMAGRQSVRPQRAGSRYALGSN